MKSGVEQHPLYGEIRTTINTRARRIILRAREGFIEVVLPPYVTREAYEDALAKYGEKLSALSREKTPAIIDADYKIEAANFRFSLSACEGSKFHIRYDNHEATLYYPSTTDFCSNELQQWLQRVRVTALRHVAGEHLPQRLGELAVEHGFCYNAVTLRDSHSRWGSCSNRGNISLSIYLQLLPAYLADYVMLHELCHTREMNHGDRFWQLMDSVTCGKAKMLRAELKAYKTDF